MSLTRLCLAVTKKWHIGFNGLGRLRVYVPRYGWNTAVNRTCITALQAAGTDIG